MYEFRWSMIVWCIWWQHEIYDSRMKLQDIVMKLKYQRSSTLLYQDRPPRECRWIAELNMIDLDCKFLLRNQKFSDEMNCSMLKVRVYDRAWSYQLLDCNEEHWHWHVRWWRSIWLEDYSKRNETLDGRLYYWRKMRSWSTWTTVIISEELWW